jgi:hypothetical protein
LIVFFIFNDKIKNILYWMGRNIKYDFLNLDKYGIRRIR